MSDGPSWVELVVGIDPDAEGAEEEIAARVAEVVAQLSPEELEAWWLRRVQELASFMADLHTEALVIWAAENAPRG